MSSELNPAGCGARRWRRIALLVLLLASCSNALGSSNSDTTEYSSARLIDRVCQTGQYELHGSAEMTTGLSDDSCAFRIGPEPGSVDLLGTPPSGATISA